MHLFTIDVVQRSNARRPVQSPRTYRKAKSGKRGKKQHPNDSRRNGEAHRKIPALRQDGAIGVVYMACVPNERGVAHPRLTAHGLRENLARFVVQAARDAASDAAEKIALARVLHERKPLMQTDTQPRRYVAHLGVRLSRRRKCSARRRVITYMRRRRAPSRIMSMFRLFRSVVPFARTTREADAF